MPTFVNTKNTNYISRTPVVSILSDLESKETVAIELLDDGEEVFINFRHVVEFGNLTFEQAEEMKAFYESLLEPAKEEGYDRGFLEGYRQAEIDEEEAYDLGIFHGREEAKAKPAEGPWSDYGVNTVADEEKADVWKEIRETVEKINLYAPAAAKVFEKYLPKQ